MRIIIICLKDAPLTARTSPMREAHVALDRQTGSLNYASALPPPGDLKRLTSEELIGPAREVLIRHAGCDYRLRITRQGKLILTK